MRKGTISILSFFACFSAFADARLPVVNVGAGQVSARAAFGENENPVEYNALPKQVATKELPARVAKKSASAHVDILSPNRPSDDLWSKNEKPLRLPDPSEFATVKNDYNLPEEDLTGQMALRGNSKSDMDTQIAKMVSFRRTADALPKMAMARPSTINSYDVKPRATTAKVAVIPEIEKDDEIVLVDDKIAVRRIIVPMEQPDVVVRNVAQEMPVVIADAAPASELFGLSPSELKKAFKKTYMSENKHLSTYQIDNRFDEASDTSYSSEGFTSARDLSETGGVRPLEIKIGFKSDDSALSRDNYNLLNEYASVVVSNPKRAIQVSIPEGATKSADGRKLAARRLAIVEQVLRDTGVSDARIMPVLSQRKDDSFVLRIISGDQYETMTQQKRDMFGDTVSKKRYKSMTW